MPKPSRPTDYCLKPNYESRLAASYYDDGPGDLEWQPDVYRLARHLARRAGAARVIDIGAGSGKKLVPIAHERDVLVVDHGRNLLRCKETLGARHTFVEHDLEAGMPELDAALVRDAIVICADVIEHLVRPDRLLAALAEYSRLAKFVLLSTPDRVRGDGIGDFGPPANPAHVREWAIDELDALLRGYDFERFLIGYTLSNDRDLLKHTSLVISGTECAPPRGETTRLLTTLSGAPPGEAAARVVAHYLAQGSDVVWVCDEASRAAAAEIVGGSSRAWVAAWGTDDAVDLETLRRREPRITDYDFCLLAQGHEYLSSPWPSANLAEALGAVAARGYDAASATVLDVLPSHDGACRQFTFGGTAKAIGRRLHAEAQRTFPLNFTSMRHGAGVERPTAVRDYYAPTFRNDYIVELLSAIGASKAERP